MDLQLKWVLGRFTNTPQLSVVLQMSKKLMCEVSNISGESRLLKNFIEASRVYYLQLQVIVIDAKVRSKVTLHSKSTFDSILYQVLHKRQC